MKVNEPIHGFTVLSARPAEEIGATLYEMEYKKNGAKLLWIDRDDDNMTFAISFKTVPTDDTGVFHILEHSVLCGSDKYPVKEPFVNLLKTSLQTFLNALTFPDKTMYPISSRNKRDFLNLTDVYLDAVFHPKMKTNENIFRQEGWHYEVKDDTLARSGVVYSEMKGVYTSVEAQAAFRLSRLLFGTTCYGFDSGGHPEHIPELTYEAFKARHERFYCPSNAFIILDGRIPLDETLAKIESFLAPYDRTPPVPEIPAPQPTENGYYEGEYAVEEGDTLENRTLYADGVLFGRFDNREENLAVSVLTDYLCGTNSSPLTKAVLDKDLCESLSFSGCEDGTRDLVLTLTAKNTDKSKLDELKKTVNGVITREAERGLDRDRLIAAVNMLEFELRERDFGTYPKGLCFAMAAMDTWLYGGDPMQNLVVGDVFDRLREKIGTGYFENLLRKMWLDNPTHASVLLIPSDTVDAKNKAAQAKALQDIYNTLSVSEKEKIKRDADALLLAQQTPDTPEGLASLPVLPISEVDKNVRLATVYDGITDNVKTFVADVQTGGIVYAELYFDISDLTAEELSAVSFLSETLCNLPTERHTAEELETVIKTHIGSFGVSVSGLGKISEPYGAKPYAVVYLSLLPSEENATADITAEVLTSTRFDDVRLLKQLISQKKLAMKEAIAASGSKYASLVIGASASSLGVINDVTQGLAMYDWVCKTDEGLKKNPEGIVLSFAALAKRIFTRERLTVTATGKPSDAFLKRLTDCVPTSGNAVTSLLYRPASLCKKGIIIPSEIAFSAVGTNLFKNNIDYSGDMAVGTMILSYGLLWNTVRVQNGAYGAGLRVTPRGDLRFYSYRDPNPDKAISTFSNAGKYLCDNLPAQDEIDPQIIGTFADIDPLLSARLSGRSALLRRIFTKAGEEILRKERREISATTPATLNCFGEMLDGLQKDFSVCVIGSKDLIKKCKLDDVVTLK